MPLQVPEEDVLAVDPRSRSVSFSGLPPNRPGIVSTTSHPLTGNSTTGNIYHILKCYYYKFNSIDFDRDQVEDETYFGNVQRQSWATSFTRFQPSGKTWMLWGIYVVSGETAAIWRFKKISGVVLKTEMLSGWPSIKFIAKHFSQTGPFESYIRSPPIRLGLIQHLNGKKISRNNGHTRTFYWLGWGIQRVYLSPPTLSHLSRQLDQQKKHASLVFSRFFCILFIGWVSTAELLFWKIIHSLSDFQLTSTLLFYSSGVPVLHRRSKDSTNEVCRRHLSHLRWLLALCQ